MGIRAPTSPRTPRPRTIEELPRYQMQCVDCHNRADPRVRAARAGDGQGAGPRPLSRPAPLHQEEGRGGAEGRDTRATRRRPKRSRPQSRHYYRGDIPDDRRRRRRTSSRGRDDAGHHLQPERLSRPQGHLGHLSEQHRAHAFPGCFRCHDEEHTTRTARPSRRTAGLATKWSPPKKHPRRSSSSWLERESWPSEYSLNSRCRSACCAASAAPAAAARAPSAGSGPATPRSPACRRRPRRCGRPGRSSRATTRTQTMPFFACAASASSAGFVMLPLPTPAITMPLAPAATAASISAPSMFSYAMMMSTRGSTVTPSTRELRRRSCSCRPGRGRTRRRRRRRCRSGPTAAT